MKLYVCSEQNMNAFFLNFVVVDKISKQLIRLIWKYQSQHVENECINISFSADDHRNFLYVHEALKWVVCFTNWSKSIAIRVWAIWEENNYFCNENICDFNCIAFRMQREWKELHQNCIQYETLLCSHSQCCMLSVSLFQKLWLCWR